jgi:hypothetical protein
MLTSISWGTRGSPKNQAPFPQRAKADKVRLIPLMTLEGHPRLLFERAESNQVQLAGKRASAAKSILYPKRIDSGDF